MIAPARRISYHILLQIASSDAHSDELLRSPEVDALSAQDRHLTTTLVLGTLRWQLTLDARIQDLLARPEMKLSAEVATTLRMGAYQLLYLDRVPAHAVINDSVELVKFGKERGAAGMVNAVLRKIQRSEFSDQRSANQKPEARAPLAAEIAARWAHPAWMVERWVRWYGLEAAEAICRWDQEAAGVSLRVGDGVAEWGGIETEPGAFLVAARRVVRGDVARSEAFREGRLRIQDEGSQLIGELTAAATPGADRVLDACAAPGGKTLVLAERLPGAEITAVDVSRGRLDAMRTRMQGAMVERIRFEVADVTKLEPKLEWDLILCDVPCSGTGTMARNPEIRLRVTEEDLARQHKRQAAILRAGLRGLKVGGRLVYSSCSLEPEENEQVVQKVLASAPEFRVVPVEEILDRLADRGVVTPEGRERLRTATEGDFLRTLPGVHPCDGFFAAVLTRN
ncbi:MAG TPA: 16S rRNA (cytosine(967)-C(5))-methyltransferase RsmB [Acidobacteriaceae bacterium]|jgi:16S rRNA (cytosine967-C5)-methyltransferase|nr:16S rRNA (cytosine(967)-C(5))-methyltransferase RsmB [Acidobacteriaceae bacterium]